MIRYLEFAKCGDLHPGTGKTISVNGQPVALFNVPGSYHCHAIDNTCPHEDGPPWAKARFAAASSARPRTHTLPRPSHFSKI